MCSMLLRPTADHDVLRRSPVDERGKTAAGAEPPFPPQPFPPAALSPPPFAPPAVPPKAVPPQALPPRPHAGPDPHTLAIAEAIIAELQSEQCMPMLLETLTQALAIQVRRPGGGARKETPRPASGLAPYILRRVIAYVHEHLQEPLSLDALAAVAGLSTCHFCRMFRRSTGVPPYQYLARLRIARAKRSLLQTSLPVGDIAFRTGFGSSSQFSHCFRKQVGCTPQEYRRRGNEAAHDPRAATLDGAGSGAVSDAGVGVFDAVAAVLLRPVQGQV